MSAIRVRGCVLRTVSLDKRGTMKKGGYVGQVEKSELSKTRQGLVTGCDPSLVAGSRAPCTTASHPHSHAARSNVSRVVDGSIIY